MSSDNAAMEKKKVALALSTYEALKDFSRFNGLKLRLVVDTLTELLMKDEVLREKVIAQTLSKQQENAKT